MPANRKTFKWSFGDYMSFYMVESVGTLLSKVYIFLHLHWFLFPRCNPYCFLQVLDFIMLIDAGNVHVDSLSIYSCIEAIWMYRLSMPSSNSCSVWDILFWPLSDCAWDRWHQTMCFILWGGSVWWHWSYGKGKEGILLQLVLFFNQHW